MNNHPFHHFDPSRYQTVSNLPLQTIVTLAKALDAAKPKGAPKHVEQVANHMRGAATEAEAAMVERLREDNEVSTNSDKVLDIAVDPLWSLLRRRFEDWQLYMREDLDFLVDDPDAPPEVEIEELRDKATRAQRGPELRQASLPRAGPADRQRPGPDRRRRARG